MKKFMAIILTAALLLSGSAFAVSAEESESDARVSVTACDTLEGWHGAGNEGIPEPELNDELSDYPVVSFTYTGTLYANGGWSHPAGNGTTPTNGIKLLYLPTETEAKSYDISEMGVLAFDMYISHASLIENANFQMEIGSGGKQDVYERNFETSLKGMKGSALEDGWNHFEISLGLFADGSGSDNLPMDMTSWNFMRFYNMSEIALGDTELVIAFRNIYFAEKASSGNVEAGGDSDEMTVTEDRVPIFDCSTSLGVLVPDPSEKTAGVSSISYTFGVGEAVTRTNRSSLGRTVDATGMDSLEFDLYVSDLGLVSMFANDAFIGDNGIELSSAGKADHGEVAWKLSDIFKSRNDWKVGWNHVTLALTAARETQAPSTDSAAAAPFDISAINFLGIYWVMKSGAPDAYTIKFDNIALTTAQAGMADKIQGEIDPVLEMAEPLKDIKLANINADNYETITQQYNALDKAYNELSGEARTAIDEVMDISKIIRTVGRALENYEKTLEPEPEQPGTTDPVVPGTDDEQPSGGEQTGGDEQPSGGEQTGGDEQPSGGEQTGDVEPTEGGFPWAVVIIGGAVAIVVIAVVVVLVIKKKK